MASFSYQLQPGTEAVSSGAGFYEDAIVVGAAAPTTAGFIELRVDLVNSPTQKDIVYVLKAFIRRLEGERFNDTGGI
jgi:hypothetical protein